jgi:glucokinase
MKKQEVYAIGVDIGGTNTKIGLVDTKGNISNLISIPTHVEPENPENFIEKISAIAMQTLNIESGSVVGIGVSCLGMQNDDGSGPRYSVNAPGLNDFDIRGFLQSHLDLPVKIMNDLMAHTLAEYHFGVGKNCKRFLCVPLGTGIGAAAIINGEPVELWGGTSGDGGRIPLEPESEYVCAGHVHGSAEALCGVAAIEEYAKQLYQQEGMTAKDVITACRLGDDPIAQQIMARVGRYTGHLIAILAMVFGPERVALAGGTTNAGQVLLDSCRDRFSEIAGDFFDMLGKTDPPCHPGVEIVFGEIKGEAGLVGGALGVLAPFVN